VGSPTPTPEQLSVPPAPVPPAPASVAAWVAGLPGGAEIRAGSRLSGDFSDPLAPGSVELQHRLADAPWTWLSQVHGNRVVIVDRPGAFSGVEADAAVTSCPRAALVVRTADCAPIGLASPEGIVGAVHAGWRGLMAGIVEVAVTTMRLLGAVEVSAALGPCIGAHAYRFSRADLGPIAERYGPDVLAFDDAGYPALNLSAAVLAALASCGATLVADARTCTHCSVDHWSWRANRDTGRQATVVWLPDHHGP
jgi:polyphenol oxidase